MLLLQKDEAIKKRKGKKLRNKDHGQTAGAQGNKGEKKKGKCCK